MQANAIAERPRALIAESFLVQPDTNEIPIRRGRSDDADWLFFTTLAGHKRKRAVARIQRFEAKHHHIAGRIVAPFRARADVVATEVTVVSTAGQQIRTVGPICSEADLG